MRRIALVLLLLSAACAEDKPKDPDRWSGDPDADLRAAFDGEDAIDTLEAWPMDRQGYRKAPATQIVLTERLLTHVGRQAVFQAYEDAELLRVRFGEGKKRNGQRIPIGVIRAGLLDAVVDVARDLVAGDRPDRDKALEAMQIAMQLRSDGDEKRLTHVVRWIEADTLDEFLPDKTLLLADHKGPRVLALMDHFTLGGSAHSRSARALGQANVPAREPHSSLA